METHQLHVRLFHRRKYVPITHLTLILLTWRIWLAHNNVSRWQMGFNSAYKVLNQNLQTNRKQESRFRSVLLSALSGTMDTDFFTLITACDPI